MKNKQTGESGHHPAYTTWFDKLHHDKHPQHEATPPTEEDIQTGHRAMSLQETFAALPVVDKEKVQELRRAISDGSFDFDAGRVADKLFAFETRLPRRYMKQS